MIIKMTLLTQSAEFDIPSCGLPRHHLHILFLTGANPGLPSLCPVLKDLIHSSSYWEIFSFSVPHMIAQYLEMFAPV